MHVFVHLRLQNISQRIDRLIAFRQDLEDGLKLFKNYGFVPEIFVYPYAFCEAGYEYAVRKAGFKETYACPGKYRIQVEDLLNEHSVTADS